MDEGPYKEELERQFDYRCYDRDRWTGTYYIYDMEVINENERGGRTKFGRSYEHVRGYKNCFDHTYEKSRTKRKIMEFLSENPEVGHAVTLDPPTVLGLNILREEWRVGDYVIAFDDSEVT